MDLTIQKFIDYLEKYIDDFRNRQIQQAYVYHPESSVLTAEKVIEELVIAKSIIHYFQMLNSDIKMVFNDFANLSRYLLQSTLSVKEQIEIIFYLCNRNFILSELDRDSFIYDFRKLRINRFNKMKIKEATDLLFYSIFPNIFVCDEQDLRDSEIKIKEKLVCYDRNYLFEDLGMDAHNHIIINSYLGKRESFTKQDVEETIIALTTLGVNNELCQKIRNILLKDMRKRLEKEKLGNIQMMSSPTEFRKESFQFVMNQKQVHYEEVYSELEDIVDLRDMTVKCNLSLNQIIYYVSLLLSIKVDRASIEVFLRNVEIENNRILHHPVTLYLELYDKLKYYADKLVLLENLKLLEDYFQEMMIVSDEDYVFWKENLRQELQNYLREIPGSFYYEFEEATKRLKRKK